MDWVQEGVVETIPPSVWLPVLEMAERFNQTPAPLGNRADKKPAGQEEPPTYSVVWVGS